MTVPLSSILIFAAILFVLGLLGFMINRKSLIHTLMSIELLLLAVNTNFIAFCHTFHDSAGEIFVFFILTVAAVEAAIGLAIMMVLFRTRHTVAISELNRLKG